MSGLDDMGVRLMLILRRNDVGHLFPAVMAIVGPHLSESTLEQTDIRLTDRQVEMLDLISRGYTNLAIGRRLCMSEDGVKTALERMYLKLRVRSRVHAVRRGFELGILTPGPCVISEKSA